MPPKSRRLAVRRRFCENEAVMKNYLWKYFFPGILLIGCAFWVGTLPSLVFSFLGFLSFFLAGVALIIEGRRKAKTEPPKPKD